MYRSTNRRAVLSSSPSPSPSLFRSEQKAAGFAFIGDAEQGSWQQQQQMTPLWEACLAANWERYETETIIETLLSAGANPFIEIEPRKIVLCVADEGRVALNDSRRGGQIRAMPIPAGWSAEGVTVTVERAAGFLPWRG